jgi:hypothetical protein
MSQITAVMIDSREPEYFQKLKFGGVPVMVAMLDTGDVQAVTDDGHTLIVERKTLSDFLNTLKDDRLFPQLARMTEIRNAQIRAGETVTSWPYLIITDPITADHNGKVIADRGVTGWSLASVMGTILSIQELGVFVCFANGQLDYEDCILRIGRRSRSPEMMIARPKEKMVINELLDEEIISKVKVNLPPARIAKMLTDQANFLLGIPGIGPENTKVILEWSGYNVAQALTGLTDIGIPSPIGLGLRRRIRDLFGLSEGENFEVVLRGEPTQVPAIGSLLIQGEK